MEVTTKQGCFLAQVCANNVQIISLPKKEARILYFLSFCICYKMLIILESSFQRVLME